MSRKYEWRIRNSQTDKHLVVKNYHFRFTTKTWNELWKRNNEVIMKYQIQTNNWGIMTTSIRSQLRVSDLTTKHWTTIGYTGHGNIQIRINPFY